MSNTAPSSNSAPRAPKRTSTPRAPKRTRTTRVDAPQSIPSDSDDVDDEIPVSFAGDPEIMQHNDACAPVIRDALDFDEVIVPRSSAQASIKWSAVNHDRLEIVADVQDFLISNRVGASSAANMLKKPRVPKRLDWINDDRLVDFRLGVTPPSRHVILRIEDVPGLTVKGKDKRRNCKWCTDSACVTIKKGRRKTKKVYRVMPTYKSHKYARKTYHACLSCMVPLCKTPPTRGKESCFEKWHRLRYMPSV